ncbi:MAG TPA: hypothetical protein VMG10_30950 [Gemmataceae bacterium]|nr:hypothetical protein [Gemmataceae bacterium]
MLECRLCGAHISSLDAEASRRIAGAVEGVVCPTCAVGVREDRQGNAVNLVRELWEQSAPEKRCPHIRYNGSKCRCAAVDEREAEMVCDVYSLQLWCLDGERYPKCLFYPKGQA